MLEMGNYINCSHNEEDGLYYDWREYPQKVPCKALNKNIKIKKRFKTIVKKGDIVNFLIKSTSITFLFLLFKQEIL